MTKSSQICRFCGRQRKGSTESLEENPFCKECLPERLRQAADETRYLEWQIVGEYAKLIDLSQQKRQ